MKTAVIIPAYNEEEYLPLTLDSLVSQTQRIDKIMIVDDGSSDGTPGVCKAYAETYENVSFVTNLKKEKRASGSKVVRAFQLGLKQLNVEDYDIIAKIDSDIGFPADYFERISETFLRNPKAGLAGGICLIRSEGEWVEEVVSNRDHVRGALKAYRREAYVEIGGLTAIMGWDSLDEFLLRYHGWEVIVRPELKVRHYRVTHSINGWYRESVLNGEVFHKLGYNLLVASMSSAKRGLTRKPFLLGGMVSFLSYLKNRIFVRQHILSPDQRRFINSYRLEALKSRFKKDHV